MKYSGPVRLHGSFDELVFYTLRGIPVARRKGSISKAKLKNDPKYERFRQQGLEFGQVQRVGARIRRALLPGMRDFRDIAGDNQLNQVLCQVKKSAKADKGKLRDFDFTNYGHLLDGFDFHSESKVCDLLQVAPLITRTTDGNGATLALPPLAYGSHTNAPAQAAYIRVLLSIGLISNYRYVEGGYVSEKDRICPPNVRVSSDLLSLTGEANALTLTASLPDDVVPAAGEHLLIGFGVEFYDREGKRIEGWRGMRIAKGVEEELEVCPVREETGETESLDSRVRESLSDEGDVRHRVNECEVHDLPAEVDCRPKDGRKKIRAKGNGFYKKEEVKKEKGGRKIVRVLSGEMNESPVRDRVMKEIEIKHFISQTRTLRRVRLLDEEGHGLRYDGLSKRADKEGVFMRLFTLILPIRFMIYD